VADLDDDGRPDLVVGVPGFATNTVDVVYGGQEGTWTNTNTDTDLRLLNYHYEGDSAFTSQQIDTITVGGRNQLLVADGVRWGDNTGTTGSFYMVPLPGW